MNIQNIQNTDFKGTFILTPANSQTREEVIMPGLHPGISFEQQIDPVNITVGGATVFILPVDRFLHF